MRTVICTDELEITEQNIVEVLHNCESQHNQNVTDINRLLNFESGIQPLMREKKYRKDINIACVDNLAHEVTQFKCGYHWGNPITLIQRGVKDSGTDTEIEAIALLNEQYEVEGIKGKTQELARFTEITDLGYTHIDMNMNDYEEGSYFNINVIDPRYAYVVHSTRYIDKRIIMAVTFSCNNDKTKHYTCYTKEAVYQISKDQIERIDLNPIHMIPIIPWYINYDGMGCFEHQIDAMNEHNLLLSDYANSVEQDVQTIWHTNDVDFPVEIITLEDGTKTEQVKKPISNDWLQTYTSKDGKTPFVKPLSMASDYNGMLENIKYRRNIILEKCYVPQRNNDNGGSTGLAMQNATGYTATEIIADAQQNIMEFCKMQEVKVVLATIKAHPNVPIDSPLLKIKSRDIQPNIKRMKLSEMATKVNSLATMLSHGVNGRHAFETANLFPDVNQVWADSQELVEKYQVSIFDKQNDAVGGDGESKANSERTMQDQSDQVNNSPNLKG